MKFEQALIVGLASVALVACGVSDTVEEAASAPVEDVAGPSEVEQEPISARVAAAPSCDSLAYDQGRTDCVLALGEDLLVFFDYGPFEGDGFRGASALTIAVNPVDGGDYQVFEETVSTSGNPELGDVNNDGMLELMVPTYLGNVNTSWSVYQQLDGGLAKAGEVSGLDLSYDDQTGLTAISARSSAVSWVIQRYRLDDAGLTLVYALNTDMAEQTCSLDQGPAFATSGLNANDILTRCEAGMGEE